MVKSFGKIVKLNPSNLAFLSGLFLSIAINLLTDLVFGNPETSSITVEWVVLTAFLIASIALAILASDLEKPHQHWALYWRDTKEHHDLSESDVIKGAIKDKLINLAIEFLFGSASACVGIALLLYSAIK